MHSIEFIETDVFTEKIRGILTDEEYGSLQAHLIRNPAAGVLIPEGGGLRKLRWVSRGKGKRGGARILYYLHLGREKIYMIYAFRKSEQSDLTREQLRGLALYVKGGVL